MAFYLGEGAQKAALAFVMALEGAFRHLGRFPAAGSQRYAHELNLPDLRCWPVVRYPYRVFFVDAETHVDVWRVLHEQRDIPGWLSEQHQ